MISVRGVDHNDEIGKAFPPGSRLATRAQAVARSRTIRLYENGPNFQKISARESSYPRSGVGKAFNPAKIISGAMDAGSTLMTGAKAGLGGFKPPDTVRPSRRISVRAVS